MNIPAGQAPGKREAVQGMFAAISPSYDRLNRLLSAGQDQRWRRRAVAMFGSAVKCVLDVAAGTGDLSAAWLSDREGARVLSTDFVRPMCVTGATKLAGKPGLMGYLVADALVLPVADASFDGVMAAFGVRNFENLSAGLAEMARVIRPGGELLVLEFFPARSRLIEMVFRSYFHHILPRIGGWISGERDAYRYLPASVGKFASREQFRELLEKAGFADIEFRECSGGIASAVHAVKA